MAQENVSKIILQTKALRYYGFAVTDVTSNVGKSYVITHSTHATEHALNAANNEIEQRGN
jgi:hypothetical protein